jgi:hypothetical protein
LKHSKFKYFFLFTSAFFLFLGCDSDNKTIQSLGQFDIEWERRFPKKIYKYVSMPGSDTIVHEFLFDRMADTIFVRQFIYANDLADFERSYWVAGGRKKLIDEYLYEYPPSETKHFSRTLGDIAEWEDVGDGRKYNGLKVKIHFTNENDFRTTTTEEDTFEKDTALLWNNESIQALKFSYVDSRIIVYRYLPFRTRYEQSSKGTFYYARNIGLMRMEYVSDSVHYEMNLVSIDKFLTRD